MMDSHQNGGSPAEKIPKYQFDHKCWHHYVKKSQQLIIEVITKEKSLLEYEYIPLQEYLELYDDFDFDWDSIKFPELWKQDRQLSKAWNELKERLTKASNEMEKIDAWARYENCFCLMETN